MFYLHLQTTGERNIKLRSSVTMSSIMVLCGMEETSKYYYCTLKEIEKKESERKTHIYLKHIGSEVFKLPILVL